MKEKREWVQVESVQVLSVVVLYMSSPLLVWYLEPCVDVAVRIDVGHDVPAEVLSQHLGAFNVGVTQYLEHTHTHTHTHTRTHTESHCDSSMTQKT